jgi:hypothetical protein
VDGLALAALMAQSKWLTNCLKFILSLACWPESALQAYHPRLLNALKLRSLTSEAGVFTLSSHILAGRRDRNQQVLLCHF